ncbi:MAG TPA: GntR family transcriptional regulator [Candidatus Hydrogenedentes bacterium]|nr:GntR family transcriptional regulator [Candidatus Hydrogenedentota bacterium]
MGQAKQFDPQLLNFLSSIDLASGTPVYQQLQTLLLFAIASGKLKPGEQIPPARELAGRINANVNTISKAYRDLVVMGLLYTRRGMGVYVNPDMSERCREDCRRRVISNLAIALTQCRTSGLSDDDIKEIVHKLLSSNIPPNAPLPSSFSKFLKS